MKKKPVGVKCIVKKCANRKGQGKFVGALCGPCFEFITTGKGKYSQVYRNAKEILAKESGWKPTEKMLLDEREVIVRNPRNAEEIKQANHETANWYAEYCEIPK